MTPMVAFLVVFALAWFGGLAALLAGWFGAPHGHEDAEGFHVMDGEWTEPEVAARPIRVRDDLPVALAEGVRNGA